MMMELLVAGSDAMMSIDLYNLYFMFYETDEGGPA